MKATKKSEAEIQINLFAEETKLERLTKPGVSLERMKVVDYETYRLMLENAFQKEGKAMQADCRLMSLWQLFKRCVCN